MTEHEDFAEKIRQRLSLHEKDKTARKHQIDGEMKQLLGDRERFSNEARRLLQAIVCPRMQELSSHFEQSHLLPCDETSERCKCEFPHTQQFPATVTLAIGFLPEETSETLKIYSEIIILPIHIEHVKNDQLSFAMGAQSDDQVARWVETKILYFIDKYLQLESHPTYQKENLVRDPICGMEISVIEAVGKVENGKQTFYFCSEACRQAFLKGGK
jgi:YHS domain-containing protein